MTDDSSDQSIPRRTRTVSTNVAAGRAARLLVAPFNEKLGALQVEAIKFEAIAQRSGGSGAAAPDLIETMRLLQSTVREQSDLLEQSLATAPDPVRLHSRVADVRTVLRMIEERIDSAFAAIGASQPSRR